VRRQDRTLISAEIVLAGSLNAKGEDDSRVATLAGVCAQFADERRLCF